MTTLSPSLRFQILALLASCRRGNTFLTFPEGWSKERLVEEIEKILTDSPTSA